METSEKLQKILAQKGFGSRRVMEVAISEGRVKVNGKVAKLGDRATASDKVEFDAKTIRRVEAEVRVLMYNKPEGQVCTRSDEEGRPTVFERLPSLRHGRWVMVGRLDINTSGLLLFTTSGDLANRLMHPKYEIEREYAVRVFGDVTDDMVNTLKKGVMLEDGEAKFDSIRFSGGEGSNAWYHVVLHEGKNKEVRRLWESQGVAVSRLTRVRYAHLTLPAWLKPGRWEELDEKEIKRFMEPLKPMKSNTQ